MGLLRSVRPREPRLPLYRRLQSQTKDRYSDDEWLSEDDEPSSQGSSRSTSGSGSGLLLLQKKKLEVMQATAPVRRAAGVYPYRLPAKVTRYLFFFVVGFIVVMILSLIRASQVENWKVANGQVESRPPPPPLWEKFPFLERYYGGLWMVVPVEENTPEYPHTIKDEPSLLKDVEEEELKEEIKEELIEDADSRVQQTKDKEEAEAEAETKSSKRDSSVDSRGWNGYKGRNEETETQECFIDRASTIRVPELRYYNGRPKGFPEHVVGSYEVLKLPEDICFDRYGRYGPYGFGYSMRNGGLSVGEHGERNGSEAVWAKTPRVDFRAVDWADVQRRCFRANADRFHEVERKTPTPHGFYIQESSRSTGTTEEKRAVKSTTTSSVVAASKSTTIPEKEEKTVSKTKKLSRTAVVVRCWDEYQWREDDIAHMRSLITELAMASGGRYDIHLLVQVKNDRDHPIWADEGVYRQRIEDVIPLEFRNLVTLWTETQMLSLYQGIYDLFSRGPELPVHGVYRGLSMAMQYFAYMHPEYEHFWQWEMDVRYTGHYYDLFTKLEGWAKAQPRKGLWERNARFYFPSMHGSWDDFSQMSRVQSEMGVVGADDVWSKVPGVDGKTQPPRKSSKAVWGPVRPQDNDDWFEPGNDPVPPITVEKDRFQWGVDEEADLISLNPLFDPEGTTWGLGEDITGFNRSEGLPPAAPASSPRRACPAGCCSPCTR